MNKLIVALIAGAFAAVAAAQGTAPSDKAEKAKAKQEIVKEATKSPEQTTGAQTSAEAKKATEASKGQPKLKDKETKAQRAKDVGSVTGQQAAETTGAANAEAVKKSKSEKGTPKALPDKAAKQQAVKEAGKQASP